jgi:hypothetical protein
MRSSPLFTYFRTELNSNINSLCPLLITYWHGSHRKLILLVQEHECLYNLSNPDYDNNLVKDNVWKDITRHLHSTVDDCKAKWALLRSYYRRALCHIFVLIHLYECKIKTSYNTVGDQSTVCEWWQQSTVCTRSVHSRCTAPYV